MLKTKSILSLLLVSCLILCLGLLSCKELIENIEGEEEEEVTRDFLIGTWRQTSEPHTIMKLYDSGSGNETTTFSDMDPISYDFTWTFSGGTLTKVFGKGTIYIDRTATVTVTVTRSGNSITLTSDVLTVTYNKQ